MLLVQAGNSLIIFCPKLSGLGQGKQAKLLTDRLSKKIDIHLVTYDELTQRYHRTRFLKLVFRIFGLRRILNAEKCQKIVAFGEISLIISVLTFTKVKIIYACRDDRSLRLRYDFCLESYFLELLVRIILFFKLAKVLCQSDELYKNYHSFNKKVPFPIPNYITIKRSEKQTNQPQKHVAVIGRYSIQKNQLTIIDHIKQFSEPIVFYGTKIKETPSNLANYMEENPSSFVEGKLLTSDDYQRFSAVVVPSLWEGIPNVFLEAFEVGVPVILSKNIKIQTVIQGMSAFCENNVIANYIKFVDFRKNNFNPTNFDACINELIALPRRGPFYGSGFNVFDYNKSIDELWINLSNA